MTLTISLFSCSLHTQGGVPGPGRSGTQGLALRSFTVRATIAQVKRMRSRVQRLEGGVCTVQHHCCAV